ncbi:zinc metalloproteinase-disintegrin-like MTP4 [Ruditapes philippinarum]|uniref:zinc metalloproteinase-disintegrin-like MTP4 n=1 Tax=Ruditapes philippinarum TaxID=129788 RepID=UPI00295BFD5E|nr:zinc metalloproteinase-disintegrin-like MTP4 [Ruditapes philippinarum]
MLHFAGIISLGTWYLCTLTTHALPKLSPLTGDVEQVTVNEITIGKVRLTRDVQDCHFPSTLNFTFRVKDKQIILDLKKNIYLSRRVPIYVTYNGRSYKEEKNSSSEFALYQDKLHGSAVLVTCQEDFTYRLHGSFNHNDVLYHMSHSNVPEPSPYHFIQPTHEPNKDFNDDTEMAPDDDYNVRSPPVSSYLNGGTSTSKGNVVELLFTVDKALHQKFSEIYGSDEANSAIELYAALLANEIDLHYSSVEMVDPSLSIRVFLTGVVIPKVGSDVSWSLKTQRLYNGVTYLDKLLVLPSVRSWLINENSLPQHDHLMALSTLDLADFEKNPITTGVEGRAYVGTVCSPTSKVSFSEVDGKRVSLTAAHELGHGLSARHDSLTDCQDSTKNIMSAILSSTTDLTYSRAQWTFSSCSVAAFKSFIQRLKPNCLKKHAFTDSDFEELQEKSLPGTVYSLTQQCQMYNGIWSTSCDSTIKEENCYNGYHCSTSSILPVGCEEPYYPLYPLAGTPCGAVEDNKWCFRGRCVEKTTTTCNESKKCCVKTGKKRKCCKGKKCCEMREAADTQCYKSCCPMTPCFQRKCCAKIKVNGSFKRVCCKKAKCCKKAWGKETKCCLTCKK